MTHEKQPTNVGKNSTEVNKKGATRPGVPANNERVTKVTIVGNGIPDVKTHGEWWHCGGGYSKMLSK